MKSDLPTLITTLHILLRMNSITPGTVKARLVEHAFIAGVAHALGGVHKLPPIVAMYGMSGRSILDLEVPKEGAQ